jgi:tetratricopeptide (TPR) repeat protein
MGRPVRRFGLLCSVCTLLACSTLEHRALPVPALGADEAYLMARQHQLARSSADAVRLYRQALVADPQHINARNGLATALAEQGDLRAAIVLWQGLIAQLGRDAGPATAYLFSNLGYAYFLDGQYGAAQQAQERACLLDPANAHAWQRLAATLEQAGDAERAARMARQAHTLERHDVRADAALAGRSVPAATPVAPPAEDGWAQVELMTGVDGLLTLQRTAARAGTASLEISNGNGVPGMARATARRLQLGMRDAGVRLVRVNNEAGFAVRRTRIEYQPALRAVAQRLARQVQPDAVLVEAPEGASTGLRLVLGHNAGKPGTT